MIVHSECGGELIIDPSARTEIVDDQQGTSIYRGIRCADCGKKLGLLPDVAEEEVNTFVN